MSAGGHLQLCLLRFRVAGGGGWRCELRGRASRWRECRLGSAAEISGGAAVGGGVRTLGVVADAVCVLEVLDWRGEPVARVSASWMWQWPTSSTG